ncbi:MAG: hypothetical protein PHH58_11900, partial [Rhodoferax sp.]|nr:hypothetical protein [Rhodoferax sp.]
MKFASSPYAASERSYFFALITTDFHGIEATPKHERWLSQAGHDPQSMQSGFTGYRVVARYDNLF